MSFILDALKKSESDRQRQSAPALFEVKVAAPRRRFPLWAVGLAVLLAVNAAVLAWVVMHRSGGEPPAAAVPANTPAPAPAPTAARPPNGEVTVPATVTFQVNVPAASVPASPNAIATPPDAGVVAPSPAPPLAEDPMLSGSETSVPPDYDSRDYRPAITPEQAGAAAAVRRAGGVPSRDEMLARGTRIPDLRMDLHVYDADPAKRFVFINMRKLREGESLPEGVRVDEITQSGARLSYQGNQFALGGN
ncbi:MAG TPA: general secretion pathway protein GspB [Steroidobacteraceae bacterium]|nr:general secretion pathway protein GspB [Steroidobacteraceae bacterium]